MTREEAKKNLVAYMYYAIDDLPEDVGKALDMAIEALKQEPREDCISRETARRIVDSGRTRPQMIDMILATPPVTPQEPKTGHWIFEGDQCFSCSSCGRIYTQKAFEYLKLHKDDSDFPNNCPNCGAKMIEPKESEE